MGISSLPDARGLRDRSAHIMPNIFIIMVDEKLLSSIGSIKMQSVQQMSTHKMP